MGLREEYERRKREEAAEREQRTQQRMQNTPDRTSIKLENASMNEAARSAHRNERINRRTSQRNTSDSSNAVDYFNRVRAARTSNTTRKPYSVDQYNATSSTHSIYNQTHEATPVKFDNDALFRMRMQNSPYMNTVNMFQNTPTDNVPQMSEEQINQFNSNYFNPVTSSESVYDDALSMAMQNSPYMNTMNVIQNNIQNATPYSEALAESQKWTNEHSYSRKLSDLLNGIDDYETASQYNPDNSSLTYDIVNGMDDRRYANFVNLTNPGTYETRMWYRDDISDIEDDPNNIDRHTWQSAKGYDFLTDEERQNYNAIYNTYGEEAGQEYLDNLGDLTQRKVDERQEKMQEYGSDHPYLALGTATAEATFGAPLSALEMVFDNAFSRETDLNQGLGYRAVQDRNSLIQGGSEAVADSKLGRAMQSMFENASESAFGDDSVITEYIRNNNVASGLYGLSESMLENGTRMLISGITTSGAMSAGASAAAVGKATASMSAAQMMIGAAGQKYVEDIQDGKNQTDAMFDGMINGIVEGITEKIALDNLFGGASGIVRKTLSQMFVNGIQEGAATALDNAADFVIFGDESQFVEHINEYINEGYSKEEAIQRALMTDVLQIGADSIGGVIMGAGEGVSASSITNAFNERRNASNVSKSSDARNSIVEIGLESQNDETRTLAQSVADGDTSKKTIRSLIKAVSSESNIFSNIMQSFENKGISEEYAAENAQAVLKYMNGDSLNQSEQIALESEVGQSVLNEINEGQYDANYENTIAINDALEMARNTRKSNDRANVETEVSNPQTATTEAENRAETATAEAENSNENVVSEKTRPSLSQIAQVRDSQAQVQKAIEEGKNIRVNSSDVAEIVNSTEDGTTVRLNNGMEVDSSQLVFESRDMNRAYENAAKFNDKVVAENYIDSYIKASEANTNGVLTENTFNGFWNMYYEAGENAAQTFDQVTSSLNSNYKDLYNSVVAPNIAMQSAIRMAYAYGENKAARNSAVRASEEQVKAVESFAKILNANVQFTDEKNNTNGYYKDGTIYISRYADKAAVSVFSHEFTHRLKQTSTEGFNEYRDFVVNFLKKEDGRYESLIENLKKNYGELSEEDIQEELVANSTESFLFDKKFAHEVASSNKSLAKKIVNLIDTMLKEIKAAFGERESISAEAIYLESDVEALKKAKKLWLKAIKNAETNDVVSVSENIEYSRKPLSIVIDSILNNTYDKNIQFVNLGETPKMLSEKLGFEELPVLINASHIYPMLVSEARAKLDNRYDPNHTHYHGLGKGRFMTLLNTVNKSGIVIKSNTNTNNSDVVVVTNMRDKKGIPVFVIFSPNENRYIDASFVDINRMKSAYGKDSFNNYITNAYNENRILIFDENKSQQFLGTPGLQLPVSIKTTDYSNNLSSYLNNINVNNAQNNNVSGKKSLKAHHAGDLARKKERGTARYSMKNSQGGTLTQAQAEYFKDSKVRDEDGNLAVVYHGTPRGGFTVFKNDLNFFTTNKSYADGYQEPSASARVSGKEKTNAMTYEGYLNIKKPFDILNDSEARDLFINEYVKGGWAQGINPYMSDAEIEAQIKDGIDWVEADNLKEFFDEEGYDYDGLVLNEGGYFDNDGNVVDRGTSYVTFNSNQFKNIDNENPTSNEDIRFSLKQPVEQTKDLIAVHTLNEKKLMDTLNLGGFPMPSIAITKSDMQWGANGNAFGDISVLFGKDTIDPKASKNNKVYSADAWTPTFPSLSAKVSDKAIKDINAKLNSIVDSDIANKLGGYKIDNSNTPDIADRYGDLVYGYNNNAALMYAYLKSQGKDIDMPSKAERLSNKHPNEAIKAIADITNLKEVEQIRMNTYKFFEENPDKVEEFREAINGYYNSVAKSENSPLYNLYPADDFHFADFDELSRAIWRYHKNGISESIDYYAAKDAISKEVDKEGFEKWLGELFSDAIESKGIRNNKDIFTSSGNRRSWEALHDAVTLENVVKNMKSQQKTGGGIFGSSLTGSATREFSSIDDIRKDRSRLVENADEQRAELLKKYEDDFSALLDEVAQKSNDVMSQLTRRDTAREILMETIQKAKTLAGMQRNLNKEAAFINLKDDTAQKLYDIYKGIESLPTDYFEAKPERAVDFNEIKTVVLPDNSSEELIKALDDRNIPYETYKNGDAADRIDKINAHNEVKFSKKNTANQIYVDQFGDIIPVVTKKFVANDFNPNRATASFDAIRKSLSQLKGQSVTIKSSNSTVYFDDHTVSEYAGSEYTKNTYRETKALKGNVVSEIKTIVENAKGKKYSENTKDVKRADATRGVDHYNTEFAINKKGNEYTLYKAHLIIRKDKNGKDYVYDMDKFGIKKEGIILTPANAVSGFRQQNVPSVPSGNNLPNNNESVKKSLKQYASDMKLSTKIDDAWDALMDEEYQQYLDSEEGKYVENEASILEEGFDILKGLKSVGGANFTHNKAVQIAKTYIQQYNSTYGVENLAKNIEAVFAYIQSNDVNYGDMIRVMKEVARPVLEYSRGNTEYVEQSKPFRDYVKSLTLSLNASQKAEVIYTYGSMDNFRKAVGSKITIRENGTNIDNVWSEICEKSGYLLDPDEGTNTQVIALANMIETMSDGISAYDNRDAEQSAYDIALNIYTDFFKNVKAEDSDVTKIKQKMAENVQKYEEAVDLRFSEMIRQMEEAKKAEVENIKKQYQARLEDYKASNEVSLDEEVQLEEMRAKYLKLEKQLEKAKNLNKVNEAWLNATKAAAKAQHAEERNKHYAEIKRLKKELNQKLAENRQLRDEAIERVKMENRAGRLRAAESRRMTQTRNSIRKIVEQLSKMITNPTDGSHIPSGLINSTIEVLNAIDLNTGRSEKMAERLSALKDQYEKVKAGYGEDANPDFDEDTYAKISRLKAIFDNKSIAKLTAAELDEVLEICRAVRTQIQNTNKFIESELNSNIFEAGKNIIDDIMAVKGEGDGKLAEAANKYLNTSLNAMRFFRRLVGYKENSSMLKLVDELNEGSHKQMQIKQEVSDIMKPVIEGDKNQKEVMKLTGEKMSDWIDTPWKDSNGNTIKVPAAMRISLALHMQNNSNMRHIIHGGLTLPNAKSYRAGNMIAAYGKNGHTIQLIDYSAFEDIKKALANEDLTVEERERLVNKYRNQIKKAELQAMSDMRAWVNGMSDFEKKVMDSAAKYFHEYSGKKINETSIALNGYTKARVENYFPIKTDRNFTATDVEGVRRDASLEGWGNLKSRTYGGNPIVLEDVFNVINNHSDFLAKYAGLAIPIRNFNKVYKVTLPHHTNTVKKSISLKWGDGAKTYIENLMTDLQTSRSKTDGFSRFMNTLRGNFAQATLTTNISVAWKQAASFPTAAYSLGWDAVGASLMSKNGIDLVSSFVTPFWLKPATRKTMELARQYTPLLEYRNAGNSTQELGDLRTQRTLLDRVPGVNKAVRGLTNWIQNIDTTTVATLWKAAEYRVSKDYSNLQKGTDEYYQQVAKVFNKAVEDTQPNYTVMQRPDILRSPNEFTKQVFMFKTQPLQNLGIVVDATGNLQAKLSDKNATKAEKAAAVKEFALAISSQTVAAITFAGMTLAANALMHRMDRYRDEDKELVWESIWNRFINDVGSCFAGALPLGSEVYDFIQAKLTGNTYYGLQVSTVEMANDFLDHFNKLYDALTKEDGVDVDNARKYAESLAMDAGSIAGVPLKNVKNIIKGIFLHAEDYQNEEFGSFEAGVNRNKNIEYHRMMEAFLDGDSNKANEIKKALYDELGDDLYDSSHLGGYLKKQYESGQITTDEALNILEKAGADEDEAYWMVNKWETGSESHYDALENAILSGKTRDIDDALDELLDHGYTEEKILQSDKFRNAMKESLFAGDLSDDEAVDIYMSLGFSKDDATEKVEGLYEARNSDTRSDIKDSYLSGSISQSEAIKRLEESGLDENEVHWKIVSWETGSDSHYVNVYSAIEANDTTAMSKALEELNKYGYPTADNNWSCITSQFKPIYIELYNTNKTEAANLKNALLNFYAMVGKDREDKSEDIDKWVE